jgi:hypothetical protein
MIKKWIRTWILALPASTLSVTALPLDAQRACAAKVKNFEGEQPILTLPARYRDGIIRAVLPDLKAQANGSAYDLEDLRPAKLAHTLHYWQIPMNSKQEHLWVVRFNTPEACGPHASCPSYVISSSSKGLRNVLQGRDPSFGTSAGGAGGIAVLPTANAAHPELLFLSHISAFETAVGCFLWDGSGYRSATCTPECAHFLDTPRPN